MEKTFFVDVTIVIKEQEKETGMKDYNELDFTNDFLFCKILENNEELCKELLELILGKKVKKIVYLHKQEVIDITSDGKGIRLDVYLEDNVNTVYDIEMQAVLYGNLPKRSRYYQGMIDLNLIQKGDDYSKLKKSYIIFICLNNPFDGILHKYTFENLCLEKVSVRLNDESVKIFLTPDGTADDVSAEMADFLGYLAGKSPQSNLSKKIDEAVIEARNSEKWRCEYMTLLMRDQENIQKGIELGIEQGIELGQMMLLAKLAQDGTITIEQAAEEAGMDVQTFIESMNQQ